MEMKYTGKKLMKKQEPPSVKKSEDINKKEYTQEEEDMITYGMKDLVDFNKQQQKEKLSG